MLKAILFDLDGTLIDSEKFYCDGWNEILAEWGAHIDYEDWLNNYAGKPIETNLQTLITKYGISTPTEELIERRKQLTLERFKTTDVQLMPYVTEILTYFASKGLVMAVVTSSIRSDVEAIFKRNGLHDHFQLIITRTEVKNAKPHPEGYQLCCQMLNLATDECLVFEDTINGLTAAKAAGLTCYAIQSNTTEHPKLQAADKIFLDFSEVKRYMEPKMLALRNPFS